MDQEITRNYAKPERLYKVNDSDYIDIDCIQAIHTDKEKKELSVLYFGVPIVITSKIWARHITEHWLDKSKAIDVCKELGL